MSDIFTHSQELEELKKLVREKEKEIRREQKKEEAAERKKANKIVKKWTGLSISQVMALLKENDQLQQEKNDLIEKLNNRKPVEKIVSKETDKLKQDLIKTYNIRETDFQILEQHIKSDKQVSYFWSQYGQKTQ